jgi:hypothetical protein
MGFIKRWWAGGPGVIQTDQVGCPVKQGENVGAPTFKVLL